MLLTTVLWPEAPGKPSMGLEQWRHLLKWTVCEEHPEDMGGLLKDGQAVCETRTQLSWPRKYEEPQERQNQRRPGKGQQELVRKKMNLDSAASKNLEFSLSRSCLIQVPRIIWTNVPCFEQSPDDSVNIFQWPKNVQASLVKALTHVLIPWRQKRTLLSPELSGGFSSFNPKVILAFCQSHRILCSSASGDQLSLAGHVPRGLQVMSMAFLFLAVTSNLCVLLTFSQQLLQSFAHQPYLCLNQLPVTTANTRDTLAQKEGLFQLTLLEVLVHNLLALLGLWTNSFTIDRSPFT